MLTALIGWLLTRRREPKVVVPTPKRGFDIQALAATMAPQTIAAAADAADETIVALDEPNTEPAAPNVPSP